MLVFQDYQSCISLGRTAYSFGESYFQIYALYYIYYIRRNKQVPVMIKKISQCQLIL